MSHAIHKIRDGLFVLGPIAQREQRRKRLGDLSAEYPIFKIDGRRVHHGRKRQRFLQLGDHGSLRRGEMLGNRGEPHRRRRKRPILHAGNRHAPRRPVHLRLHRQRHHREDRLQRHRASSLVERHQQQHQQQRRDDLPHHHPLRRRNLQRLRPPRHHPPLMKGAITLSSRTHPRRLRMV